MSVVDGTKSLVLVARTVLFEDRLHHCAEVASGGGWW
jgi:hypothetical protein